MAYEPFVGFGTRKGIVYELNADNLPDATSTTAYVGLEIYGVRGLQLQQTNVRRIAHFDGDAVALVQILPTTDVPSGTLTVDGADLTLDSVLGNVKTSAPATGLEVTPFMNDQQGSEPNVGLIIYQAAKKNTGQIGWHVQFIPTTQLVAQPGSFGDNNYETVYQMAPSAALAHLWGIPFSNSTDGTERSGVIEAWCDFKPRMTAWKASGAVDVLTFDVNHQPTDDANVTLFAATPATGGGYDVEDVTDDYTITTTNITLEATGNIPSGTIIIAFHDEL